MRKFTGSDVESLRESYNSFYQISELNEEQIIENFMFWVDSLIEEGHDLSEYTYNDLYEYYINEGIGSVLGKVGKAAWNAGKGAMKAFWRGTPEIAKNSQYIPGAKQSTKEILARVGRIGIPIAAIGGLAGGLDKALFQGELGKKASEWTGAGLQQTRQGIRSIPSPGQPSTASGAPQPRRRNLPPASLTQSFKMYGDTINEDPQFPTEKPKAGDWAKLTRGGITKFWDPETNSYQLPGTINKRLISQGEKPITIPGRVSTPTKPKMPGLPPSAAQPGTGPKGNQVGTSSPPSTPAPRAPSSTPAPTRPRPQATSRIPFGKSVPTPSASDLDKYKINKDWAAANPRLAQAQVARASGQPRADINKILYKPGTAASQATGESQMEKQAQELRTKRQSIEKSGITSIPVNKESYDAFDVLLDYLLSEGHTDTLEESIYVMMEMDSETIQSIYHNYLIEEEFTEWVNSLLEEGYDLSEYTWDDIVEYYVSEANRGDEHVTSSMYMSREPDTTAAKVRRRQIRDNSLDSDHGRQLTHKVSRGRKKPKPISHDTLAQSQR